MSTRNQLIAQVKIGQKDLGLDDETYRDMLERITGKRSAAQLSQRQLADVVAEIRQAGGLNRRPFKKSSKGYVRLVWALWGDLAQMGKLRNPKPAGLKAFVKRMAGVDDPEFLTNEQATPIIEALKKWKARKGLASVEDAIEEGAQ